MSHLCAGAKITCKPTHPMIARQGDCRLNFGLPNALPIAVILLILTGNPAFLALAE